MGQKVHPIGIRLGITKDWASTWYADSKTFPEYVATDHKIREFLRKRLKEASVSRIQIERPARKVHITIHTARPGIVIGKKGEDIEKLRVAVAKMLDMSMADVRINIAEIRKLRQTWPEMGEPVIRAQFDDLERACERRVLDGDGKS